MKIGIDVSQFAYENTGVANYLQNLVLNLVKSDRKNEYTLFFSSMRRNFDFSEFDYPNVKVRKFKIPPTGLDIIWNKLHKFPIENFIGDVDLFITSDWTEPPVKKAKKATFLYDLIVYKYPKETHEKIVGVQKRKLKWVKKESDKIFCISKATAQDAIDVLGLDKNKLEVVYPGL